MTYLGSRKQRRHQRLVAQSAALWRTRSVYMFRVIGRGAFIVLPGLLLIAGHTVRADQSGPEDLHRQALASVSRGDTATAANLLERAISLGPPTPDLLYDAAYLDYRRQNPKEARALVQRSLRQAPDDPQALTLLGLIQME